MFHSRVARGEDLVTHYYCCGLYKPAYREVKIARIALIVIFCSIHRLSVVRIQTLAIVVSVEVHDQAMSCLSCVCFGYDVLE